MNAALAFLEDYQPGSPIDQAEMAGLAAVLENTDAESLETLRRKASDVLAAQRGIEVYYRGLLEFTNHCERDCLYCGIRASNHRVKRYRLSRDEIVETCLWCAANGYGSITLQSGESGDPSTLSELVDMVAEIKQRSVSENLPAGLGITLSLGELSDSWLERFRAAGAHRYLLRVETSNPQLYARLHPDSPDLQQRIEALRRIRAAGFQTGSGVMIGLPDQTCADLAADLAFLVAEGVHMIGMGPYQPHADTPLNATSLDGCIWPAKLRFERSLRMIGLARLLLPGANIAAATALQALHPFGRERGLDFGANIVMPLVTPGKVRELYALYDAKPCADEETSECKACLEGRIQRTARPIGYNDWGDSLLFNAPSTQGVAP